MNSSKDIKEKTDTSKNIVSKDADISDINKARREKPSGTPDRKFNY